MTSTARHILGGPHKYRFSVSQHSPTDILCKNIVMYLEVGNKVKGQWKNVETIGKFSIFLALVTEIT